MKPFDDIGVLLPKRLYKPGDIVRYIHRKYVNADKYDIIIGTIRVAKTWIFEDKYRISGSRCWVAEHDIIELVQPYPIYLKKEDMDYLFVDSPGVSYIGMDDLEVRQEVDANGEKIVAIRNRKANVNAGQ